MKTKVKSRAPREMEISSDLRIISRKIFVAYTIDKNGFYIRRIRKYTKNI